MSKTPPFPVLPVSSSLSGSNPSIMAAASSSGGTRPLQINRAAPASGNNMTASPRHIPTTSQFGPSRPQRSELRTRQVEHDGYERTSTSSREHIPDVSQPGVHAHVQTSTILNGSPSKPRSKPSRLASQDDDATSPASLASVVSAFQSAGIRRRATAEDMEYERAREQEIENERRRQQRIRERAPGRMATGRANIGDIDAVLDQIKDGWEFVVDPDFNCVDLALQLFDQSSQGKNMKSFRQTKDMLSNTLKSSVDRYYQAFASSLPHHASLINRLSKVQNQVVDARSSLLEAKEALGNKRADLVQLWSRSNILEEMIRLLDQIEYLKSVPDLLETLISEKRLLQASVLLVRSMKLVNNPDMLEIGAVTDLRSYLNNQDSALRDILIDELQSHLYLKSFWCESRWCTYVSNQKTFPSTECDDVELGARAQSPSVDLGARHINLKKFLQDLTLKPNDPPHDLGEHNPRNIENGTISTNGRSSYLISSNVLNPEADSFAYMESLIESLAVLGKLGNALDTISQRLSSEIFTLVETTLNEVEERAEYGRRSSVFRGTLTRPGDIYILSNGETLRGLDNTISNTRPLLHPSCLRLAALEAHTKHADREILRDLFWTLFSKLDAVVQGFRVVSEVANRVGSRRDFRDSSGTKPATVFPLDEVWYPIQAELHSLIRDYLVDEEQSSSSGRHPILSINEVLREGKLTRDKNKNVFRLADTDLKLVLSSLRSSEDELNRLLKDTMPGLVPGTADIPHSSVSSASSDERFLGSDQHHRLLIRPDAFHVNVLFQPSLTFLDQIANLIPSGIETLRSFRGVLDDFVLKVYLPQLEEKVSDLFHGAITGPDAFEPDPFSLHFSSEPLIQSSTSLFALINSLCALLTISPFHRENYTRLILSVIIQFYQRCSDRYQDLVSVREGDMVLETKLAVSAQWSQRPEVTSCLTDLLSSFDPDDTKQEKHEQLCQQETEIELRLLEGCIVSNSTLLPSTRQIAALAALHHSVSWFASELHSLRSNSEVPAPASAGLEPLSATTPYTPRFQFATPSLPSENMLLPLSREMALRYHALLKTYEQLSGLILDTIRIEIRCRTIYYIDYSMRHGNYTLEGEAGEPDPYIMDLNRELALCDELLEKALPEKKRHYIFCGLGHLMEHLMIRDARLLRLPNAYGIKKVLRNVLALQQSTKSWSNQQTGYAFERAKQYYSLFFISPQQMLDGIRERQSFSFDNYQIMLNLQCGVDCLSEDGAQKASDRNYSMYVIDLHGLEMEKATV